jgi:membrane protein YqaA with SNARE-associated domain
MEHLAIDPTEPPLSRREIVRSAVRLVAGVAAFLGLVAIVSWAFRAPLEVAGRWFVARFGMPGMAVGSFLADAVHFPVPPQFYLVAGIAAGAGRAAALGSVLAGSVLGGFGAFAAARAASRTRLFQRRTARTRNLVQHLVARHGYWGLALATLFPVSYWVLCSLAGIMRLPFRAYGVLALMRVPRILLSYAIIAIAWGAS